MARKGGGCAPDRRNRVQTGGIGEASGGGKEGGKNKKEALNQVSHTPSSPRRGRADSIASRIPPGRVGRRWKGRRNREAAGGLDIVSLVGPGIGCRGPHQRLLGYPLGSTEVVFLWAHRLGTGHKKNPEPSATPHRLPLAQPRSSLGSQTWYRSPKESRAQCNSAPEPL